MADELAVWIYGDQVALIERDRRGPRLTYTETALARRRRSGGWVGPSRPM